MLLIYKPANQEPMTFEFDLGKFRVKDRESIERATGMSWGKWKAELADQNTRAMRGLLWINLRKRTGIPFDDVDFSDEEIEILPDSGEVTRVRAAIEENKTLSDEDRAEQLANLETLEAQLAEYGVAPKAATPSSEGTPTD